MMLKRFSGTVRAGTLAALFVIGSSAAAFALPIVSFTTSGSFGSSGNNVGIYSGGGGTAMLTFNGVNPTQNIDTNNSVSNANFGDFLLTTTGNFTSASSVNDPFTLSIFQTAPTGGNSTLAAVLNGTFVVEPVANCPPGQVCSGTNFAIHFNQTSTTIGGVTYTLQSDYLLAPPTSGAGGGAVAGDTTIQGTVAATTSTPVPEPASMLLLGTGLLAAFRARRKVGIE